MAHLNRGMECRWGSLLQNSWKSLQRPETERRWGRELAPGKASRFSFVIELKSPDRGSGHTETVTQRSVASLLMSLIPCHFFLFSLEIGWPLPWAYRRKWSAFQRKDKKGFSALANIDCSGTEGKNKANSDQSFSSRKVWKVSLTLFAERKQKKEVFSASEPAKLSNTCFIITSDLLPSPSVTPSPLCSLRKEWGNTQGFQRLE